MTTRITQRQMSLNTFNAMQGAFGRLSKAQEQLSSGRQINRPSDSPTGTNDAMRLRAQIAADNQYARNAQDGASFMGTIDNTMTSMEDQVNRARDLIVQGSSTGNNDPDARAAIAQELTQLRKSLIGLANTQYLGRPVFGGTTGGSVAYDDSGTFQGDAHDVTRTIGPGVKVKVNVSGSDAFANGSDTLFSVLDDAVNDLTNNPGNTAGDLTKLDGVAQKMRTAHADLGTRANRVDTALTQLQSTTLDHQSQLSDIENVDLAQASIDVQLQSVAYQAALGATAKVIQPSLLDFLR